MTKSKIQTEAAREGIKYDVAVKIRELLDAARKQYGAEDWDGSDLDGEVQRLVFEE